MELHSPRRYLLWHYPRRHHNTTHQWTSTGAAPLEQVSTEFSEFLADRVLTSPRLIDELANGRLKALLTMAVNSRYLLSHLVSLGMATIARSAIASSAIASSAIASSAIACIADCGAIWYECLTELGRFEGAFGAAYDGNYLRWHSLPRHYLLRHYLRRVASRKCCVRRCLSSCPMRWWTVRPAGFEPTGPRLLLASPPASPVPFLSPVRPTLCDSHTPRRVTPTPHVA